MDMLLESPAQVRVRELVQELSEDTPSLAWRSGLNERLLAERRNVVVKRRRTVWACRSSLGFGLAATLAVALFFRPHPSVPQIGGDGTFEATAVAVHQNAIAANDVAGPGLTEQEASAADTTSTSEPFEWNQSDVASL